jgi:hypothetical protein
VSAFRFSRSLYGARAFFQRHAWRARIRLIFSEYGTWFHHHGSDFRFNSPKNSWKCRRLKDLVPIRKYGVRNHNDERQLNSADIPGGDIL